MRRVPSNPTPNADERERRAPVGVNVKRAIEKGEVMGLFDLFRKKQGRATRANTEWFDVAANLSGTLWTLLQTHPEMLANPYSRVVLRDDWSVGIACDKRPPDKVLGAGEVSFVFLREDQSAYDNWINGLRNIPDAVFQKIETEQFAKVLVHKLAQTVDVVD